MFNFYKPVMCTWEQAVIKAEALGKAIGAKRVIEVRATYGGCYMAKYYMGSTKHHDLWLDNMIEVKIYDNTPHIPKEILSETVNKS